MSKDNNNIPKKPNPAYLNHVIDKDAFDHILYEGVRDSAKKLKQTIGSDESRDVRGSDVFSSLYKMKPEVSKESAGIPKRAIDQMMKLPEYEQLRAMTETDELCSALGTQKLLPGVLEAIAEYEERQEEQKKNQQQNSSGGELGDGDEDGQGSGGEGDEDQEMPGDAEARSRLRSALQEAQEEAEDWQNACQSWGIDTGELHQLPMAERMNLADKMMKTQNLRKLSDYIGRFKNLLHSAQATSVCHGVDEIVDIAPGSDIMRALPTELLKFRRNPTLFMKDLAENNLLCYNLQGVETLGQGPIICCVDMSGSMQGDAEMWSKAVALALALLAEKQNRAFGFIGFDNEVKFTQWKPKGTKFTIDDKIRMATSFSGGGTNFWAPLKKAFKMREQEPELLPADIVFITDGCYNFQPNQLQNVLKKKEDYGMRIHGVYIDEGRYTTGREEGVLSHFCDSVASVNNLGEIDGVRDIINATASQRIEPKT